MKKTTWGALKTSKEVKKVEEEKVYIEQQRKKRVGRPTSKQKGKSYSRINFDVTPEVAENLKLYKLALGFKDQNELLNAIVGGFIDHNKHILEGYLKKKLSS